MPSMVQFATLGGHVCNSVKKQQFWKQIPRCQKHLFEPVAPSLALRKCLRWTFAAAWLSCHLLTWFLASSLAEEEMQEDFSMKNLPAPDEQGSRIQYTKNELCIEPVELDGSWKQKTDRHYIQTRIALSLSFVLLTPRSLVELPLHLHCRGDHPGKGAGKELGARVLFATWMSKEHWKTVDQRGFEFMVPMLAVSKFILGIIQVAIWLMTKDHALLVQIAFKMLVGS